MNGRGIDANAVINKLSDRISGLILETAMLQARVEELERAQEGAKNDEPRRDDKAP